MWTLKMPHPNDSWLFFKAPYLIFFSMWIFFRRCYTRGRCQRFFFSALYISQGSFEFICCLYEGLSHAFCHVMIIRCSVAAMFVVVEFFFGEKDWEKCQSSMMAWKLETSHKNRVWLVTSFEISFAFHGRQFQ